MIPTFIKPSKPSTFIKTPGFSMLELMVVMVIIGILGAIVYPGVARLHSNQKLSKDSYAVDAHLQKARLKAAMTQKPMRVVLDCSKETCWVQLQTPVYYQTNVESWDGSQNPKVYFNERTKVSNVKKSFGHDGDSSAPKDVRYAIFMPDSRVFTDPKPFDILIHPAIIDSSKPLSGFRITITNDSGRVGIKKETVKL
jgi:prepilin-type N-terminal cleavage/methylation domain-containing protein